jgi:putative selenium metabolism protein SsnA
MSILLKNVTVASPGRSFRSRQDIYIDNSIIKQIAPQLDTAADTVVECHGKMVMPGFVCAHNHIYSALSRGIMAPIKSSPDFISILKNLWWRLDLAIDEQILEASAGCTVIDAIKAGVTTIIDHHSSPHFIDGSLSVIGNVFEKKGMRGVLCFETTNRNGGIDEERRGVNENLRFAREIAGHQLIGAQIGAHAPFTLDDKGFELLSSAVASSGCGLHMHIAEDRYDVSVMHERWALEPGELLERYKLLTDTCLLGHGLYLSPADIEKINRAGAFIAHNARSNMNNNVGYQQLLPQIARPVLGTDGMGSDMLEEIKFAYFKHCDAGGVLTPQHFMQMLDNSQQIIGKIFKGRRFGLVEEGCTADLIMLDYQAPTPLSYENLAGHAVFGMASASVESVLINGNFVMRERELLTADEEAVKAAGREAARTLWQKMTL